MNNYERMTKENNLKKQEAMKDDYEILLDKEEYLDDISFEEQEVICEIISVVKKRKLSYRRANEVLYHTDRVLRERASVMELW